MKAIDPKTRATIKAYLEVFIEAVVKEYKGRDIPSFDKPAEYLVKKSPPGQLKPFHAAIIPNALMRINEFERGFSTRLGTTFEECARLIALSHHKEAGRAYVVTSKVSLAAINEIEHQVALFEHATDTKTKRPSFSQMIAAVLAARRKGDLEERSAQADLRILANDGTEFFFEIKSPMPNKGQCLEVTQRLLRFHLLRGQARPSVSAYFAMGYNPYGLGRTDYKWSFARNYMHFDDALLIGQEFWQIVGGPTAYEELLEIYQEVGKEKSKYMIDALAFGF